MLVQYRIESHEEINNKYDSFISQETKALSHDHYLRDKEIVKILEEAKKKSDNNFIHEIFNEGKKISDLTENTSQNQITQNTLKSSMVSGTAPNPIRGSTLGEQKVTLSAR